MKTYQAILYTQFPRLFVPRATAMIYSGQAARCIPGVH